MRWLRLGGVGDTQSIDSNVIVQHGWTVDGVFRVKDRYPGDGWLCGSRATYTTPDQFGCEIMDNKFYMYYGSKRVMLDCPDMFDIPYDSSPIYRLHIEPSYGSINGRRVELNSTIINPSRSVFIGSVNTGGEVEKRAPLMDVGELILRDETGTERLHVIPVKKGSTEYSTTPAPSDCLFDLVSKTYKVKYQGKGMPYYEDDAEGLSELPPKDGGIVPRADYGLKVLSPYDDNVVYLNSAYKLIGTDISRKTPQIRTYKFTVLGDASEPPVYPNPFTWDNVFRSGHGMHKKHVHTIKTGIPAGQLRIINLAHSKIGNSNLRSTIHEAWWQYDGDGNFDVYFPANSTDAIFAYSNFNITENVISAGATNELFVWAFSPSGNYPTRGYINGSQPTMPMMTDPSIHCGFSIEPRDNGDIDVYSTVAWAWGNRASGGQWWFTSQWWSWWWLTGITFDITTLITPYHL